MNYPGVETGGRRHLPSEESVAPTILFDDGNDISSVLSLRHEFFVDEKELSGRIDAFFRETGRESFTLGELLGRYPALKGLEEIVTYITIAEKRESGAVNSGSEETVLYSWNGKEYSVRLPEVRFYAK